MDAAIKLHNLGQVREIVDLEQEEMYPIWGKGNSVSVDKCSTMNALLYRTPEPAGT